MFTKIINELSSKFIQQKMSRKDLLIELFNNQELKNKYNDIRRSTIVWQLANEILLKNWMDDNCKVMAIGDIKYFWKVEKDWEELVKNSLNSINVSNLSWYDLSWQWTLNLREILFNYMSYYYDLKSLNGNKIINSIIPTYGGTDWFVSILDTFKTIFPNKNIKFIYPEASFLANVKIAESFLWENNLIKVNKPKPNNFFFSQEQIDSLYKSSLNTNDINIYYVTPVGNPTWHKIDSISFIDIIAKIASIDKNAIFIFDNVYIWILKQKISNWMFKEIFANNDILNKIIFTESLSKTLWATGLRLGWLWTYNEYFSLELKKNIILKKAGFSKILNEFIINLLSDSSKIINFQNEVHEFWSYQRKSFFKYIKHSYSKFFDFELSPEVLDREGIYVLLKVKGSNIIEEIFAETGIIWVWINLSDWLYIRYAFWNVNYF